MAVRIKNRVEYDFDLPPIQLTAVRDANLYAVEKLIEYAIEHRDEVEELAEVQKTQTDEEIAAAQAELMGGATTVAEIEEMLAQKSAESAEPAKSPADDLEIPPPPTNPAGTFATWAIVTGKSPGGIFNSLPAIDDASAEKMAQRLTERAEGTITVDDVRKAQTIEELSTTVREFLESGELDGFVRTIRAAESEDEVPVYVFHAAGGSTVVYEPLLKRLPAGTPMIGLERVEGSIEERAAVYVPKLLELNGWTDGKTGASGATGEKKGKPFILAGWSLGGALSYACAIGLKAAGADVSFVGLIDCVRPGEPILHTKEETRKRWDRYAKFAEKTFNVEIPEIPYEHLETLDDAGQVQFVLDMVSQSGVQIPGGIVEHQRTSYLDNRALDTVDIKPYDGHVVLYIADRYHDDAITFEPAYATRAPDGGWGAFASDLEVVAIGGEHIQAIDEPYIAKVGAHMSEAINRIEAEGKQAK
jgi:polyketide synthase 13